ncbi:uncharacterized protein LOC119402746 [Rhipicephalus sanguineus]|uniref:uncharacterized protein LOC119402746 n=1 Tax=Rhipicephalus sanguineus TaxID=34632 RepID=UPI001892D635|nr:uncharacterized protein LOC119402746 [Rhipicephalus sanguineus]
MDVRRPKQGETDEELIRLQEEFLKSGERPSVQLFEPNGRIRKRRRTRSLNRTKPLLFVIERRRYLRQMPAINHLRWCTCNWTLCCAMSLNAMLTRMSSGLPQRCAISRTYESFGHCVARSQESFCIEVQEDEHSRAQARCSGTVTSTSLPGSALSKDDYEAVHAENLGRLASMSHEEKMKAQQELLSRLGTPLLCLSTTLQCALFMNQVVFHI